MKPILIHPDADEEIIAAARYYELQQANLGKRFLTSVEDGLSRLKVNPLLFPTVDGNIRQCLTRIFPFGILFRDTGPRIEIIAVMHLKREPGYWKSRE